MSSSNLPPDVEIIECDENQVIHVTATTKSCWTCDYKQFTEWCEDYEIYDENIKKDIWNKIVSESDNIGDNEWSQEYDCNDVPDDDAKGWFQERFEEVHKEIKKKYGECHDCKDILGPTTNIKIIAKESYEKTICSDCCPDKATMRKEGWTDITADSDDDSDDESVEGCEAPYPETKDHRPEVKIDLDAFLDDKCQSPKGCVNLARFTPEQQIWINKSIGDSLILDFNKTRDELLREVKAHADKAHTRMKQAELHVEVITEATKAFDDIMTITEGGNPIVRQSIMYRMEALISMLVKTCKIES